jgi:hypothetical protein
MDPVGKVAGVPMEENWSEGCLHLGPWDRVRNADVTASQMLLIAWRPYRASLGGGVMTSTATHGVQNLPHNV